MSLSKRVVRLFIINSLFLGLLIVLANSLYSFFILPPQVQEKIKIVSKGRDSKTVYDTEPAQLFGYPPYFKAIINHVKKSGPQLIFNKDYSFDENGARYTPKIDTPERDLIFLGGSNTFGEGVNDQAVFSYRIQEKFGNIKVSNFAYRGWGLDQAWVLLKNNRYINNKQLKRPLFFYFFYPFHLYRTLNTPQVLSLTKGHSPWIKNVHGTLIQNGLVKDQPYFGLKSFIGEFSFYRSLESIYFNYNNQVEDIKSLEAQLLDMKKHIKALYPDGELIFVLPPFMGKLREHEKFKVLLFKTQIPVIDIPLAKGEMYYFPDDGHLNDLGHLKLTKDLVPYLSKLLKD